MGGSEVYDRIGVDYSVGRRTDVRWMTIVAKAVGNARSVVNVGAGTGSYEATGTSLVAVEPSMEASHS